MTDANKDHSNEETGLRIGPLWMLPGVRPINIAALFFASFFGIAVMAYMNAGQPIIFKEILGIDESEFGRLAGNLTFYHEIVVLIFIAPIGALSDKIGRRPLYMAAFLLIGLGHFLYPLAENTAQLTIYRLVYALGTASASAMLAAVANDYPVEKSRAKMIAATMLFNAIGMVLLTIFFRSLPEWYQGEGFSPEWAITYTRWTVAAMCVVVAVVAILGLKKGAPGQVKKREPMLSTLKVGLAAARNPRIALSYGAALVSRGDLAVLSTFFTTWLFLEGTQRGMSTTEAMAVGLKFYVIIQAAALPCAVVMGFVLDKIDRVFGLAIAMVLASVGYLSLAFVGDPLGSEMYYAAVLIGLGEITANLSAISLVGKEAPVKGRGAVIGMFSLFGALGILLVAKAGGELFDNVARVGPFILVGVANVVIFVWAVLVLRFAPKNYVYPEPAETATGPA
ncbi:MAG: MFS transporter [Gammaproteobacteria bacterium]